MGEHSIVYGINPVYELIRARKRAIKKVYILEHARGEGLKRISYILKQQNVFPVYVSREALGNISKSYEHQGVVALCEPFITYSYKDFLQDRDKYKKVIIVNNVQDPHNLGAVIRSSYLFGFMGIILSRKQTVSLTPAVIKASTGAIEYVDIAIEENLPQVVIEFKRALYKVISLDIKGNTDINNLKITGPVVVIVGGEDSGVGERLLGLSDFVVKIPICDESFSLNLSVSAAIIMYQLSHICQE